MLICSRLPAMDRSLRAVVGAAPRALAFAPVAQNPNPLLPITSYKGVTRTLDDWATVFNIALIVLPDRPEGAEFPAGRRPHLHDVRRQRRAHRACACRPPRRSRSGSSATRSTASWSGSTPTRRWSRASASNGSPRSCCSARTPSSSPRRRVGARRNGSGSPTRSRGKSTGQHPSWPSPAIRPRRPAGRSPAERQATRARGPEPGIAEASTVRVLADVADEQSGPFALWRPSLPPRWPWPPPAHSPPRRLAHATTQSQLDSEQAKAPQLEAQIEANGNRVSVLDEQYNDARSSRSSRRPRRSTPTRRPSTPRKRRPRAVRDQLTARGAELYMGAGNAAPLAALDVTQLAANSGHARRTARPPPIRTANCSTR